MLVRAVFHQVSAYVSFLIKNHRLVDFLLCFFITAGSVTIPLIATPYQRAIPRVAIPINRTNTLYLRDPSIDLPMREEQGQLEILYL
jgi:hypothetical protein